MLTDEGILVDWPWQKSILKLLDVVASGAGAVSRPYLLRREGSANAANIREIAAAMTDVEDLPVNIKFQDKNLQVSLIEGRSSSISDDPTVTLHERAMRRAMLMEGKRQRNMEAVVGAAVDVLEQEYEVSPDPLDEDWIAPSSGALKTFRRRTCSIFGAKSWQAR